METRPSITPTYTRTLPNEPGLYWWRKDEKAEAINVRVHNHFDQLKADFYQSWKGLMCLPVSDMPGLWLRAVAPELPEPANFPAFTMEGEGQLICEEGGAPFPVEPPELPGEEAEGRIIHRLTHTEPAGWPDREMMEQAWEEESGDEPPLPVVPPKEHVGAAEEEDDCPNCGAKKDEARCWKCFHEPEPFEKRVARYRAFKAKEHLTTKPESEVLPCPTKETNRDCNAAGSTFNPAAQPQETPTPRTDAMLAEHEDRSSVPKSIALCRTLERELADLAFALLTSEKTGRQYRDAALENERELAAAKAALAQTADLRAQLTAANLQNSVLMHNYEQELQVFRFRITALDNEGNLAASLVFKLTAERDSALAQVAEAKTAYEKYAIAAGLLNPLDSPSKPQ